MIQIEKMELPEMSGITQRDSKIKKNKSFDDIMDKHRAYFEMLKVKTNEMNLDEEIEFWRSELLQFHITMDSSVMIASGSVFQQTKLVQEYFLDRLILQQIKYLEGVREDKGIKVDYSDYEMNEVFSQGQRFYLLKLLGLLELSFFKSDNIRQENKYLVLSKILECSVDTAKGFMLNHMKANPNKNKYPTKSKLDEIEKYLNSKLEKNK